MSAGSFASSPRAESKDAAAAPVAGSSAKASLPGGNMAVGSQDPYQE